MLEKNAILKPIILKNYGFLKIKRWLLLITFNFIFKMLDNMIFNVLNMKNLYN